MDEIYISEDKTFISLSTLECKTQEDFVKVSDTVVKTLSEFETLPTTQIKPTKG